MADKMLNVKLVRSLSGRKEDQIATANSMGLITMQPKERLLKSLTS